MKIGDLVKVLTVDGNPIGLITDAWPDTVGGQQGYVKINGIERQWIVHDTQVEVINASR